MMKRFAFLLISSSVLSTLAACSMFSKDEDQPKGRDKQYLRAQPTDELKVPEGMHKPSFEPLYPVPIVNAYDDFGDQLDLTEYEVPRPDTVTADESVFGVKIQRLSEESWVFVSAPTSQVWPHVQSFLAESSVGVVTSNVQSGLIETDWLQYSDDDSVIARFRFSLEKGLHPDSTEVHIREFQQATDGDPNAPASWPEVSTDQEREQWMVKQLANHLAATVSNASASLLGQNVGGEVKAQFVNGAEEPTLRLTVPQGRAWATLTHSANQENFVSWDTSEELGLIYAGYSENQTKKRGFWRKLLQFGYDGKLPATVDHAIADLLKHLSGAAEVRSLFDTIDGALYADALAKAQPGYLIVVRYSALGADIVVRDHRGRKLVKSEAKDLIRALRKNLI